jgi:hypothetical protein
MLLLMYHDLPMRLLMHGSFLVTTRLSSVTITHLHILITFLLSFFVVFTTAALGLEVLAASIGVLVFLLGYSGLIGASHFLVFALNSGLGLLFCELLLEMLLKLDFFGAIVSAVILDDVGFGLLRRELGWG